MGADCLDDVDCDDGYACTMDSCDEANDPCARVPSDAICDAGTCCSGDPVHNPTLG
jgi:hypothetical protein